MYCMLYLQLWRLPICNENQWDEDYFDKQIWGSLGDFIRKLLKEEVA